MFRFIKNENGIALMMVIVLLILVGGLTAALMSAGVFNIRFGGDEVEMTQSLYAADAGVEYMKNWVRTAEPTEVLNTIANNNNDDDNILFDSDNDGWVDINNDNDDLQFRIKLDDVDGDTNTFISEGKYDNQNTSEIKFSFDLDQELINQIMFLINQGMYTSVPDAVDDNGNLGYDYFNFIDTLDTWNYYLTEYEFYNSKIFDQNTIPQNADSYEINKNTFYSNNIVIGDDDEYDGEEFDDSTLKLSGGATIKDSIIAIDGNFRTSGGGGEINFENSLVLVRGEFNFGGSLNLDNSMIISFNDGKESDSDTSMTVRGGTSLTTEPITDIEEFYSILDENDEHDTHELAEEILDEYFKNLEIDFENIVFNSDWRQIR